MSNKRLKIYLEDHLGLMVGELELIDRCRGSNSGTPLAEFLRKLENEVTAQKTITHDILRRMGSGDSLEGRIKQGAAWLAEKLGRLKLNDSLLSYSPLSRVIELEGLAVCALERVALWDNLDAQSSHTPALTGITCPHFRDLAEAHLKELNTRRRYAAAEAFQ